MSRASARSSRSSQQFTATSTGRAPTATAPSVGCGSRRTEVGRARRERVAAELGKRAMARDRRRRRGTPGTRSASATQVGECVRGVDRFAGSGAVERDERHDVERAECAGARRRASCRSTCSATESASRLTACSASQRSGPGKREHRPVVVRSACTSSNDDTTGRTQRIEHASSRVLRHTLGTHSSTRAGLRPQPVARVATHRVELPRRCASGSRLPQYDYSFERVGAARGTTIVELARGRRARRIRLVVAVRPPPSRRREVRRPARPRGLLRSTRVARRALPHRHPPAPRHARDVRSTPPRLRARQVARHPRPHLWRHGSTSESAPVGTSPTTSLIGIDMPPPKERLARLGETIEVCRGLFARRAVHVRRRSPPLLRGAEPADRGPGSDAADLRGRQGRPAPGPRGRARRRMEHLLGLDTRRLPRASRRARAGVRGRSAAIPRP